MLGSSFIYFYFYKNYKGVWDFMDTHYTIQSPISSAAAVL